MYKNVTLITRKIAIPQHGVPLMTPLS